MTGRSFFLLYLLCFLVCTACVHAARLGQGVAPRVEVTAGAVAIAIPPKPVLQGERESSPGEGTGPGTRYDEATCRTYTGDFQDVCFQALARQRAPRDLEGGLLACREVVRERLRNECMADVAELHAPQDLDAALRVCPSIPRARWRDQCVFGISMALVNGDPARALANCEGSGMWRDFCRHDVLGDTSVRDLDFVLDACGREEGDLLTRKSCWHGIGKYIGRQDIPRALLACGRVPLGPANLYRENCVHGVGWAAGERMGAAGAAECQQAGDFLDNCLVGVAFEQKRLDPEAALGVCHQVGRSDLRDHCMAFLRR